MGHQGTTRGELSAIYQFFLGRDVESEFAFEHYSTVTISETLRLISGSEEAKRRRPPSWLTAFNTVLAPELILRSHEDRQRVAVPDRIVNYLGVKIDPAYLPHLLQGREGEVEDEPNPANWHADLAEWAAALRSVDLAKDTFRVVELGCGWGCWLLNTGVAARNRGLKVHLIGAEGDAGHIAFAERACKENGFADEETSIHRGIVGPRNGTALFPRQAEAGVSWGLEPVFDASDDQVREAEASEKFDILPILTFGDLVPDGGFVDLLHIDIQGGEADFIAGCMEDIDELVRYIVVGTHSRQIEGRIFDVLLQRGWILEMERPAVFIFPDNKPVVAIDGVQGWRNPRITR